MRTLRAVGISLVTWFAACSLIGQAESAAYTCSATTVPGIVNAIDLSSIAVSGCTFSSAVTFNFGPGMSGSITNAVFISTVTINFNTSSVTAEANAHTLALAAVAISGTTFQNGVTFTGTANAVAGWNAVTFSSTKFQQTLTVSALTTANFRFFFDDTNVTQSTTFSGSFTDSTFQFDKGALLAGVQTTTLTATRSIFAFLKTNLYVPATTYSLLISGGTWTDTALVIRDTTVGGSSRSVYWSQTAQTRPNITFSNVWFRAPLDMYQSSHVNATALWTNNKYSSGFIINLLGASTVTIPDAQISGVGGLGVQFICGAHGSTQQLPLVNYGDIVDSQADNYQHGCPLARSQRIFNSSFTSVDISSTWTTGAFMHFEQTNMTTFSASGGVYTNGELRFTKCFIATHQWVSAPTLTNFVVAFLSSNLYNTGKSYSVLVQSGQWTDSALVIRDSTVGGSSRSVYWVQTGQTRTNLTFSNVWFRAPLDMYQSSHVNATATWTSNTFDGGAMMNFIGASSLLIPGAVFSGLRGGAFTIACGYHGSTSVGPLVVFGEIQSATLSEFAFGCALVNRSIRIRNSRINGALTLSSSTGEWVNGSLLLEDSTVTQTVSFQGLSLRRSNIVFFNATINKFESTQSSVFVNSKLHFELVTTGNAGTGVLFQSTTITNVSWCLLSSSISGTTSIYFVQSPVTNITWFVSRTAVYGLVSVYQTTLQHSTIVSSESAVPWDLTIGGNSSFRMLGNSVVLPRGTSFNLACVQTGVFWPRVSIPDIRDSVLTSFTFSCPLEGMPERALVIRNVTMASATFKILSSTSAASTAQPAALMLDNSTFSQMITVDGQGAPDEFVNLRFYFRNVVTAAVEFDRSIFVGSWVAFSGGNFALSQFASAPIYFFQSPFTTQSRLCLKDIDVSGTSAMLYFGTTGSPVSNSHVGVANARKAPTAGLFKISGLDATNTTVDVADTALDASGSMLLKSNSQLDWIGVPSGSGMALTCSSSSGQYASSWTGTMTAAAPCVNRTSPRANAGQICTMVYSALDAALASSTRSVVSPFAASEPPLCLNRTDLFGQVDAQPTQVPIETTASTTAAPTTTTTVAPTQSDVTPPPATTTTTVPMQSTTTGTTGSLPTGIPTSSTTFGTGSPDPTPPPATQTTKTSTTSTQDGPLQTVTTTMPTIKIVNQTTIAPGNESDGISATRGVRARIWEPSKLSGLDTALGTIMSPQAALATTSTTFAMQTANGGAVTGMTQMSKVSSIMSAIECIFIPDDDERPSLFEHPLQPDISDEYSRYFIGATVMTTIVFITVPMTAWVSVLFLRVYRARSNTAVFVGVVVTTVLSYFVPNAMGAATTVMFHSSAGYVVLSIFCMLVILAWLGIPALIVAKEVDSVSELEAQVVEQAVVAGKKEKEHALRLPKSLKECAQLFAPMLHPVFEATDQLDRWPARLYFFEDVLCALLMSMIAGVRPTAGNCLGATLSFLIVALAHLAYLLRFRPYELKVDLFFAIANAVLIVVQAILGAIATQEPDVIPGVGVVALLLTIVMIAQFVLGVGLWLFDVIKTGKIFPRSAAYVQKRTQVAKEKVDIAPLLVDPDIDDPLLKSVVQSMQPTSELERNTQAFLPLLGRPLLDDDELPPVHVNPLQAAAPRRAMPLEPTAVEPIPEHDPYMDDL